MEHHAEHLNKVVKNQLENDHSNHHKEGVMRLRIYLEEHLSGESRALSQTRFQGAAGTVQSPEHELVDE